MPDLRMAMPWLRWGRSQGKDVVEKMQFAFALVNPKSPWTCQAASGVRRGQGQGRREPTQTLLYLGQPCEPTQGTRPNRREGAAANASPQTRGGGRTNEW